MIPTAAMCSKADALLQAYRFHPRITAARWENLRQAVDDYLSARPSTSAVPYSLFVEASSACNLRCPLCPTGAGLVRRRPTLLSFATYEALVGELASRILEIHFAFFGEPTLHPRLADMVELATRADVDTRLMTNATRITASSARALVAAGLGRVTISADAFEQVAYGSYRRGGDYRRMMAGIEHLVRARDAAVGGPLIEIQFLALRTTEPQLEASIERAWELGADRVKVKRISLDLVDGLSPEELSAFLPRNPDLHYYDSDSHGQTDNEHVACPSLYLEPGIVMSDGRLALCCRDPKGDFAYGELSAEGFEREWQGQRLDAVRAALSGDGDRPAPCHGCSILQQDTFQAHVIDRRDEERASI